MAPRRGLQAAVPDTKFSRMPFLPPPPVPAYAVVESIGVNTHIDFNAYGYQDRAMVEAAIRYLGVKRLRDSAANPSDLQTWPEVAHATGAKFDDFIGETSPAGMQAQLALMPLLAHEGVLNAIEGGNEEDDAYAASQGNNLRTAAQFQQRVHGMGRQLGLPAINMSFGAGWTAANRWHGDYDKVGDLSDYADYANAHTYPLAGQTTDATMRRLNDDARIAAGRRPVITTELGWDAGGRGAAVPGVVQAVLDGIKDHDAAVYLYALFDDMSGRFGLMNADGSPRPAGMALHNLTTLLADGGGGDAPDPPHYALSGQADGDNALAMRKPDGSLWLALWNESAGIHTVTIELASNASNIQVFGPVTGTAAVQRADNAKSVSVRLGRDPLLIEVTPSDGRATAR